jgi:hypothetical protein
MLEPDAGKARLRASLAELGAYAPLGPRLLGFWRDPAQRASRGWAEHADIDDVMLATCLVPEGVLVLERVP